MVTKCIVAELNFCEPLCCKIGMTNQLNETMLISTDWDLMKRLFAKKTKGCRNKFMSPFLLIMKCDVRALFKVTAMHYRT